MSEAFGMEVFRILKPSTLEEVFLGFDQGFAQPTSPLISCDDLKAELKQQIDAGAAASPSLYFGYFLQFKVVDECAGKNPKTRPNGFQGRYWRSTLGMSVSKRPNARSKRYQHEVLVRLASIAKTDVNYACPMIFSEPEVHGRVDLDKLRIVEVNAKTPIYKADEPHFIAFQTTTGPGVYCSTPTRATVRTVREWVVRSRDYLRSPEQLREWLDTVIRSLREEGHPAAKLPSCMTIIEFRPPRPPVAFGRMGRALQF
jgi:hypothetical protein